MNQFEQTNDTLIFVIFLITFKLFAVSFDI
jgi:hypothetical protein